MYFYKLCPFLVSHILIITYIKQSQFNAVLLHKKYICTEMSDILQDMKYLKVKLHKSQDTDTWQFSYWPR